MRSMEIQEFEHLAPFNGTTVSGHEQVIQGCTPTSFQFSFNGVAVRRKFKVPARRTMELAANIRLSRQHGIIMEGCLDGDEGMMSQ